ncbi:MAG: VOC family protein [Pseudomonadota bacterium]
MDLDHLFVFVEPGGAASRAKLEALGFVPTYTRRHEGQGTANCCYAFDNAYLELLWVEDARLLSRATFARTGLWEHATWRVSGASPFGVCVRSEHALPFACWLWTPPYLPPGMFLEVAASSREPSTPFLFRFPGTKRPDRWPAERAGRLQHDAGFAEIVGVTLQALPSAEGLRGLRIDPEMDPRTAVLELSRRDGAPPKHLRLPDFEWLAESDAAG